MTEKYVRTRTPNTDKTVYHTDLDCDRLENARPVSENEIAFHDLSLCAFCDPEKDPTFTEQDHSYFEDLKKAANNE